MLRSHLRKLKPKRSSRDHSESDSSPIEDDALRRLVATIIDYQIAHGSLLKNIPQERHHTATAYPISVSLHPTPFQNQAWLKAHHLHESFSLLYSAVAQDDSFLFDILRPDITTDPLVRRLWDIHSSCSGSFVREHELMIARSDYMMHLNAKGEVELKQVEINTFFAAGTCHPSIIRNMHHRLRLSGAWRTLAKTEHQVDVVPNSTVHKLTHLIIEAHGMYRRQQTLGTCVIMVVQPRNFNICDELPIQDALWDRDVPCFRVTWGNDFLSSTALTSEDEMIYTDPASEISYIVTVVYLRAGMEESEYDNHGFLCRMRIEQSRAIPCPSVTVQLAGMKTIQVALCQKENLARFLSDESINEVMPVFAEMHVLSEKKDSASSWAQYLKNSPEAAAQWVMKTNRDGGGHNIYGQQIHSCLQKMPPTEWPKYSLQRRIEPPTISGSVMSKQQGVYQGPVVSELGIFGGALWKCGKPETKVFDHEIQEQAGNTPSHNSEGHISFSTDPSQNSHRPTGIRSPSSRAHVITLDVAGDKRYGSKEKTERMEMLGWTFKTKPRSVDEMAVVKGYGSFDSPLLLNKISDSNDYGLLDLSQAEP